MITAVGAMLASLLLVAGLLFGSAVRWDIPMGIVTLIRRTALEDRLLQQRLPGYSDYASETRYRLIPGVW